MPETKVDTTQGNLEFNKTDLLNVPVSVLIADNNSENFKPLIYFYMYITV